MPRPKDSKVWNEDLILALQAREEMARHGGKRNHLAWKEGRQQIEAVRNDIYTFKNGRIVNLPNKLKTTVENVCRCIIAGTEPVLPAGYVPPQERQTNGENPYLNHPYLKNIKKRGGAFAILMAFYTSSHEQVLSKEQICTLAQPFCDTDMEANFMAGRARGAWSSIKTLVDHDLIMVQKRRVQYDGNANGFRSLGCNSYMLTPNGKLFIQAFLQRNPDIQQQVGRRNINTNTSTSKIRDALNLWQDDFDYDPGSSLASLSRIVPIKTSPSRPFASIHSQGHVLDDTSPAAKRQLKFALPPNEAAAMAAFERQAIQESIRMSKGITNRPKQHVMRQKSTPIKNDQKSTAISNALANTITPSSSVVASLQHDTNKKQHLQRLKPPAMIRLDMDDDDENDEDSSDRKIPANPCTYNHSTTVKQNPLVLNIDDSESDDDDSNDILDCDVFAKGRPKTNNVSTISKLKESPQIIHLTTDDVDDDDDNSNVIYDLTDSQSQPWLSTEIVDSENMNQNDRKESYNQEQQQLTIYIDDRERNRNHTPRTLRIELTRIVSASTSINTTGSSSSLLSMIWPNNLPRPIVEEKRIPNGDFTFHRMMVPEQLPSSTIVKVTPSSPIDEGTIQIPILLERKRIGDIVQRSTRKDHWYQLHRMQDEVICMRFHQENITATDGICFMLLEGDPRTTQQYESYGSQQVDTTSPFVHTIDDVETYYRYMCRAILNGMCPYYITVNICTFN
jgi:hypothetical protein